MGNLADETFKASGRASMRRQPIESDMDPDVEYLAIEGCPNYKVGMDGSVWSNNRRGRKTGRFSNRWKKLWGGRNSAGYPGVVISGRGHCLVHHLVAEAFIGPRPENLEIRHLDGNRQNNRVDNLAYGTKSENCADSAKHGTISFGKGKGNPNAKLTEHEAREIVQLSTSGMSNAEICKRLGRPDGTVRSVLSGKTWSHVTGIKHAPDPSRKSTQFEAGIERIGRAIHEVKVLNGWDVTTPEKWADVDRVPADLALIHSEVSEALEAFRKDDKAGFAEEMADTFIRVIGLCHGLKIDLCQSVRDKIAKNRERGYRHGGRRL